MSDKSNTRSTPPSPREMRGDEEMLPQWQFSDEDGSSSSDSSLSKGDQTAETEISSTSSIYSELSYHNTSMVTNRQSSGGFRNAREYFEKPKTLQNPMTAAADGGDDDFSKHELILFGLDLSHLSSPLQFFICAGGVFVFTLLYGYLQELIQIEIAGRRFALFLGSCQFAGYAFWSAVLAKLRLWRIRRNQRDNQYTLLSMHPQQHQQHQVESTNHGDGRPPILSFMLLAILRSTDLALTNLSMRYLNYPAKTLIKSSRVIFTMLMGVIIGKKKYNSIDYTMVFMLVCGLSMFVHADMNSNAVFHPLGVAMLTTSLGLDGTVSNWSEVTMNKYKLGQDEFQFKLFFFSFIIMTLAAYQNNELEAGFQFFFQTHGTLMEVQMPNIQHYSWSINAKILALFMFSTLGIFGGSCAAAITKRFGALAMSITTTTRKAATIFISFALFPNACTSEHILGVLIFVFGLLLKAGLCNEQMICTVCGLFSSFKSKVSRLSQIGAY